MMGLDIYVGSLTRYYSGNWKTITEKTASEVGAALIVERPLDPSEWISNSSEIERIINGWKKFVLDNIAGELNEGSDWNECLADPYYTDKPSWEAFSDLLIWAVYEEQKSLKLPVSHIDDWHSDPAFIASFKNPLSSRYSHLIGGVELWLPFDFPFLIDLSDPNNKDITVGSSSMLYRQLCDLNQRTWKAEHEEIDAWKKGDILIENDFKEGAKFAFSIFFSMAKSSVTNGLPMKLDY